jgi:malonyl-CoA decarboxylase
VRPLLLATCARYLTTQQNGRVLDPVGNFHLTNGALIERVDWAADTSEAGFERSIGMMANYLYEPDRIAARAEEYLSRGEVATSPAVRDLVKE